MPEFNNFLQWQRSSYLDLLKVTDAELQKKKKIHALLDF